MIKKVIFAISIILVILLSTTAFLYAENNGNSKKETFSITSSSNNGGTISPKGRQEVANGGSIKFTISTDSGYELGWLRVDNEKKENFSENSYTFDNVTKNHTIQAHFRKIDNGNGNNNSNGTNETSNTTVSSFSITASSNKGGTISPEGITTVDNGDNQTYTITADSSYELSWLKVDGKIVKDFNSTTYQFTDITSNHTIKAHFSNISNSINFINFFNNRLESITQQLRNWWNRIV